MLLVNADDLAMTPGANAGIFEGFDNGAVTHASIMANGDYFDEAMVGVCQRETLNLGMHLNLTYGKPLIASAEYCDEKGHFCVGYAALLRRQDPAFLEAVEQEWDAQIRRVLSYPGFERTITHIDSHRHIHLIPHLYKIVVKLANRYDIDRIRLIEESLIESFGRTKRLNFILNGGIVKYMLLRTFSSIDKQYDNRYGNMRFYSILYTGVIGGDILPELQKSTETYEVMVHPSRIALDTNVTFYDEGEKAYRISPGREAELQAVMSVPK